MISTKQKCNNGIQCAAHFWFWQGKGCYGPTGVQKASKKAIKKDANIHSTQSPQKSMTDQPMLTYNKLACLWQVAPLEAEMVNLEPHERFLGFHEGLIWSQHPEKCGLGMYASTVGVPKWPQDCLSPENQLKMVPKIQDFSTPFSICLNYD